MRGDGLASGAGGAAAGAGWATKTGEPSVRLKQRQWRFGRGVVESCGDAQRTDEHCGRENERHHGDSSVRLIVVRNRLGELKGPVQLWLVPQPFGTRRQVACKVVENEMMLKRGKAMS